MKLKILLILTMLAVSLPLVSCIITSNERRVEISCDEFYENPHSLRNVFQVEIGDKITVRLCSNATTSFQWGYETTGDIVLKEEDYDFEAPEGDLPGAAGVEVWTFKAVAEGTSEVLMSYSQPWEGGEKEVATYAMTVTVE